MIKLLTKIENEVDDIPMSEMKPLDIGVITSTTMEQNVPYIGKLVMRTASNLYPEVMLLSNPREDNCWTSPLVPDIRVRLLKPGTQITLEVV